MARNCKSAKVTRRPDCSEDVLNAHRVRDALPLHCQLGGPFNGDLDIFFCYDKVKRCVTCDVECESGNYFDIKIVSARGVSI